MKVYKLSNYSYQLSQSSYYSGQSTKWTIHWGRCTQPRTFYH